MYFTADMSDIPNCKFWGVLWLCAACVLAACVSGGTPSNHVELQSDSGDAQNLSIITYNPVNMTECTRQCTMHDSNMHCWLQSLEHYTRQLHKSLNEYVGTLLYIQRWKTYHDGRDDTPAPAAIAKELLESVLNELSEHEANSAERVEPLTAEEITAFVEILLNKTDVILERYADRHTFLPSFSCPLPCGYAHNMWKILFFVMLAVCLLCALSICCYVSSTQSLLRAQRRRSYLRAPRC